MFLTCGKVSSPKMVVSISAFDLFPPSVPYKNTYMHSLPYLFMHMFGTISKGEGSESARFG
jgi:hypothetical protein